MIVANRVSKNFGKRTIIDNFSLEINSGDFISITGASGRGKTTILNILGLLEKPSSGNIIFMDKENPNKKETMIFQRNEIGYLFQNYALIENDTVEKNLKIAIKHKKNINTLEEIEKSLEAVNLVNYRKKKIYELSGGEQQRVALARVLVKNCSHIFADEPTGNLDRKNRDIVFDILKKLNSMDKTIVYVTHDEELAKKAANNVSL
ncbi:MAG: ATP-binding cassette domain-containing protein [Defluviitaleaceae bacterium]|nr:ATP-binding cassette domain-containing protein [Defluviitaleaceae bacterium]